MKWYLQTPEDAFWGRLQRDAGEGHGGQNVQVVRMTKSSTRLQRN